MATYLQAERALTVTTPLGGDALLLAGFTGEEAISQLFHFQLDLLAENQTNVAFDRLLGQKISINLTLPDRGKRHFNGICNRVSQGERDATFTSYRVEIVPQFWLLTKKAQSRIFQHVSAPDILKKVFEGLDVTFELQGTFHPRDFCVQYRETDFQFASRLMEEEGIYYFFKHSADGHKMVVANTPSSHPDMPVANRIIYEETEGGRREEDRIFHWEKSQELRAGKYTLWDHCFELPHKHLETDKTIQDGVQVGSVNHKLKVGGNDRLELYDWPGRYAQRFDGVDRGGGAQPAELQKIFEDNGRTVGIRMQEEAVSSLVIRGASNCRQFVSGHKFTLERHFNANGQYVLTSVQHTASLTGDYRAGGGGAFQYENRFTCIPFAVPYRPLRSTPKPVVQGTQTAVVVGPAGEEIFTDKYGRVKVQFHWDRQGKNDAGSSCWVRVGTLWAGKQWGIIHIPRIGQEVIVDFLEGDPDNPIIVGSVYNAETMPPYELPANKTQSGIKTRSSLGGSPANFNEIRFEDKKGSELLTIHAEKDQSISVENDESHTVGHDRTKDIAHDETTHVGHDRTETVDNNETITIHGNRTEEVDKDEKITIHGNRTEEVDKNETISIHGGRTETVDKDEKITIHGNRTEKVDKNETITIDGARTETVAKDEKITINGARTESVAKDEKITISGGRTESVAKDEGVTVTGGRKVSIGKDDTLNVAKNLMIIAGDSITLQTGKAVLVMKKDGTITMNGKDITVVGTGQITVKATKDFVQKGKKILQN